MALLASLITRHSRVTWAFLFLLLGAVSPVQASPRNSPAGQSPWILPTGVFTLQVQSSLLSSRAGYTDNSSFQTYSLEQHLMSHDYSISARAGVHSRAEIAVQAAYSYRFKSGDVYPQSMECNEPLQVGARCYDPNITLHGLTDLWLSGRYRLLDEQITVSIAPALKIPFRYKGLEEGELTDLFTLGDGQVDVALMLLAGRPLSNLPLIIRLGAGYLARMGPPGAQVIAEAKLGYVPTKWLVGTVGFTGRYSLREDGVLELVGANPNTGLLISEPISANLDWSVAEAGLIFKLRADLEFNLNGELTLWGRNTPSYRGLSASFIFFF